MCKEMTKVKSQKQMQKQVRLHLTLSVILQTLQMQRLVRRSSRTQGRVGVTGTFFQE